MEKLIGAVEKTEDSFPVFHPREQYHDRHIGGDKIQVTPRQVKVRCLKKSNQKIP